MSRAWRATLLAVALAVVSACSVPRASEGGGGPVVLVAGATGGTGRHIVEQALARGYRVRALVRDEEKARMLFGDRVSYVVGDVRSPRTLPPAVRGADYVISALGSNVRRDPENSPERVDFQGVAALARAAAEAGVLHFVLTSSMGVTHPDHPLNATLDNLLQWKLRGENALRASGVPYTVVRAARLTDAPGGAGLRLLQGDPQDVRGELARADLAAVLVSALGRPETYGRTFEILGDPGMPRPAWETLFAGLAPDES